MKKYFLLVLLLIFTILPLTIFAEAPSNSGFIPGQIWYSKDKFLMRSKRLFGGKIVKRLENGRESFCLEFADSLKRMTAVKELGELFKLSNSPVLKKSLKKAYQNDCYLAKELAGEYLGYSKFRNWINEIPVAVAATAAASGLGYALYQYMVR